MEPGVCRTPPPDGSDRPAAGEDPAAHADPARALEQARSRIATLEARLEREARARATLVHTVGHELRTSLTVLSGFARLLREPGEGSLTPRQQGHVDELLTACGRLDRFVGDLLAAASETGGALAIDPKDDCLERLMRRLLDSMAPLFAERSIEVELDVDAALAPFAFDAGRIEQVLTNLLSNAIRYGRAGGLIRVAARRGDAEDRPSVLVSVEDDGPGVPPADRRRIFEPYVRGEGADAEGGLGIGLAICERIVEAHGGRIDLESGSLGGARFVFELPIPGASQERT